jgi:hypothetical protein
VPEFHYSWTVAKASTFAKGAFIPNPTEGKTDLARESGSRVYPKNQVSLKAWVVDQNTTPEIPPTPDTHRTLGPRK